MMRTSRPAGARCAHPRLRSSFLAALVATAAAVLAACGSGGGPASGDSDDAPATLNVGVIPIVDVAPLYLGMEQGFFAEENLTIEPQLAQGGAAIVPAVVSGDFQLGFSNNVSILLARDKGLPIRIVSPGVEISPDTTSGAEDSEGRKLGYCEILVPEASPIRSPEDLAGTTIAVNTLRNIGPVTINAALRANDVDPADVEYTEIGFPDMLGALESGQVDAAWECEPFVTQGIEQGARGVLNPYRETHPNLSVATYVATEPYIAENPGVIARFDRALARSFEYAASHPDEVRAAVMGYGEVPEELASKISLPTWSQELNTESIEELARLADQDGLLENDVELTELIHEG